jgi:ribosome-associated protein
VAKKKKIKTAKNKKPKLAPKAKKSSVKKFAKPIARKTKAATKSFTKKPKHAKRPIKTTTKATAKKSAPKKFAPKKIVTKKPTARKLAAAAPAIGGFPEELKNAALKVLDDRQAEDIVTISLAGRSSMADYMIVASGRASRQIAAIADYLREAFMKLGVERVRIEGVSQADWVLVDAGDVIVHLFRPEVRQYYGLESIWDATENGRRSDK